MSVSGITLDPHRRGDTFEYSSTLEDDWVGADFTGGVKFTVRSSIPATSVTDDSAALAQVSVAGGGIVFSGADFTVTIAASVTTTWPVGRLYWDMQGVITTGSVVHTIASGTIVIQPDVTRST
jgi:hypothetical protein